MESRRIGSDAAALLYKTSFSLALAKWENPKPYLYPKYSCSLVFEQDHGTPQGWTLSNYRTTNRSPLLPLRLYYPYF